MIVSEVKGWEKHGATTARILAIVVTYKAEKWLKHSLDCLVQAKDLVDIAVVDNNSPDKTAYLIQRDYKDAVSFFYPHSDNLGFGKAHNLVFRKPYARDYDYIFLLNQDAEINPVNLRKLVEVADQIPDLGILSPLHYYDKDTLDIHFAKYYRKMKSGSISNEFGEDIAEPIDFVNAAVWLIPQAGFRQVGLFNPIFPHYGEDGNYVQRVQAKGLVVAVTSAARALHLRPQTEIARKNVCSRFAVSQLVVLSDPKGSLLAKTCQVIFNTFRRAGGELLKRSDPGMTICILKSLADTVGQLRNIRTYRKVELW